MMMTCPDNSKANNDWSPRAPSRQPELRPMACTNIANRSNEEEWNVRRHNSANSLRQLAMACTPKRRSDPKRRQSRRRNQDRSPSENSAFLRRQYRSTNDMKTTVVRTPTSSTDSMERKVIRSTNSSYSLSRRIARQRQERRSGDGVQESHLNYSWSKQSVQTRGSTSRIPGAIQILKDTKVSVSCTEKVFGSPVFDAAETSDDDSSVASSSSTLASEDDFDIPQMLASPQALRWQEADGTINNSVEVLLQKNLDEALAAMTAVAPKPTSYVAPKGRRRRQVPKNPRSFGMDSDESKQRLDDSRCTARTRTSTTSASECSAIQVSLVQPPKPWICLCGEENDPDFRFCGMCAHPERWTCSNPTCQFHRNKCRQLHCGGCGARRVVAPKPMYSKVA
ncbi:expressed unknown protein [Seminavis robusta]|uniref:Uncharacterized protein n=1 Tax=Seminavis robusta TaxID=568900 RepID=A0A9N8EN17_9STRA|nr:expressed unknown protein [Seminavis robusta]|eukprot:Sro1291_g259910.1 n/a (395) ;mRNA; f:16259-17443